MARLIDADALHACMVESYMLLHKLYEDAQDEQTIKNIAAQLVAFVEFTMRVKDAPTIDTEPVRHGRWTWITEDVYRCENCGERVRVKEVMGKPDWDYCPNCGAKMDGGAEDG